MKIGKAFKGKFAAVDTALANLDTIPAYSSCVNVSAAISSGYTPSFDGWIFLYNDNWNGSNAQLTIKHNGKNVFGPNTINAVQAGLGIVYFGMWLPVFKGFTYVITTNYQTRSAYFFKSIKRG